MKRRNRTRTAKRAATPRSRTKTPLEPCQSWTLEGMVRREGLHTIWQTHDQNDHQRRPPPMADKKQEEPKKEQEHKERDYFQRPRIPANPEKSQSDTSGSETAGQRWSGRT